MKLSGERKALATLAILIGLAYIPSLLAVLLGSFPYDDDGLALVWPIRDWMREQILAGRWPLWCPEMFCGEPSLALGQGLVLYPPGLLSMALPSPWAALLLAFGHSLWLAAGMYFLARAWGLSPRAAWAAGILTALSNGVAGHLFTGHDTWHAARAWMPWLLLWTLRYLRTGSTRLMALLAVGFWLQFWAGYAPISLLTGAACALLVATRTIGRARSGVRPLLPDGWLLAAVLVPLGALLLSAASLLPFREVTNAAVHGSGMSFQEATALSGSWRTFARLLLSDFFGGNAGAQWSTMFSPHEEAAYFGLLALPLALAAPWLWRRERGAPGGLWALWVALMLACVLALGNETPVYGFIWRHSGLFRSLRVPVRWMDCWTIGGPLLAAAGFEYWLRRENPGRAWLAVCGALAAVSTVALFAALQSADSPLWMNVAQWNHRLYVPNAPLGARRELAAQLQQSALLAAMTGVILAALGAALLARWNRAVTAPERRVAQRLVLVLLAADVLVAYLKSTHVVGPDQIQQRMFWPKELVTRHEPGTRWSTDVPLIAINQGLRLDLPLYNGYDPLSSERYWTYARMGDGRGEWAGPYQPYRASFLQRAAGVSHTLTASLGKHAPTPRTLHGVSVRKEAESGSWTLWRHEYGKNNGPWPLTYVTRDIRLTDGDHVVSFVNLLASVPQEGVPPPVVMEEADTFCTVAECDDPSIPAQPRELAGTPQLRQWELRHVRQATFVHAEALSPGWKAWVDGKPATIKPGNYLFQAIELPVGARKITLVYDSWTVRTGAFLTLFGIFCLAVLGGLRLASRPVV